MLIFERIITDRGSRYAVSGGPAKTRHDVQAFLKTLTRRKKFARATHHSWAARLADGPAKGDDGEAGAGAVILQKLEAAELEGEVVVVTRWYGGKHLGGDRFRHVAAAVDHYLAHRGGTT